MLAELSTWWVRQMAGLAEPVMRRLHAAEPDALLVTPQQNQSGELSVARRRKGRIEALATIPAGIDHGRLREMIGRQRGRAPVIVVLPGPPLIREVTLPIAAEASLDRVVRYEMDRLTPFAADDVFFAQRLLGHDRARALLRVELTLVPRAWVRPLLARLGASGVTPAALEVTGPDDGLRRIPIVHADPARQIREQVVRRISVTACAVLAAATIAVPLLRQSLALAAVEERIAELRPRVEQVEALRLRIAAGSAGSGQIAAARQKAAEPLTILGVLTDALPDDTWLSSLTLRQRHLVVEGHSAAATRLISAMAGEPRLRNPSFAAPVVRAESGGEVFTIQAEVAP